MLLTETDIRRSVTGTYTAADLLSDKDNAEHSLSHPFLHKHPGIIAASSESWEHYSACIGGSHAV